MSRIDPARLSRTLTWLLRHGSAGLGLCGRADGSYGVDEVARALSQAIRRPVGLKDVVQAALDHGGNRFYIEGGRIGIVVHEAGPDLLYYVTNAANLLLHLGVGALRGHGGGPLLLLRSEAQAWHMGHRIWEDPIVLFIDAARARRDGIGFAPSFGPAVWSDDVPIRYVLNLREGFAERASAGGFVVHWAGGEPQIALIRVVRRHGATWEVAKGKIEPGETPAAAAVREVREEMGLASPLTVRRGLGTVRYGFSTPDGEPRLKTIHLYLLELNEQVTEFQPAAGEGIERVSWFAVDAAIEALTHPSLRTSISRLLGALHERATELGYRPDRLRETG